MYTDPSGKNSKPVLSIYAEREDGAIISGHAWIEVVYRGRKTSYGLYPRGISYKIGQINQDTCFARETLEGVNTNVELFKKIDMYRNYVSKTVTINEQQYVHLMTTIQEDINNKVTWGIYPTDAGVCSSWASGKWNGVVGDNLQVEDRNMFGISNPNTLADPILNLTHP